MLTACDAKFWLIERPLLELPPPHHKILLSCFQPPTIRLHCYSIERWMKWPTF